MGRHWPRAVEIEPRSVGAAIPARLDPEQKFGVQELLAAVVQQQRIDAVAVRETHAGGDKNIFPAIGVEIPDTGPPGPVALDAELIGDLREFSASDIAIEGV